MFKKHTLVLAAAFLAGLLALSCSKENNNPLVPEIDPVERSRQTDSLALVAIYNAADGANWKAGRVWDLTKAMDDPTDKWYGVTLDEAGRVTALKLLGSTITSEWELPAEIAELTELTELRINSCNLKGALPEGLYSLTKLQKLYFQTNNLSGTLSDKLGQLTELDEIYLNGNTNLGGSIPATIGNLSKLTKINCSKTALTGAIPAEIGKCTALTDILFNDNAGITGEIPSAMALPGLKNINLSNCNLTGNIPESFGLLPETCNTLVLKGNKLSGTVPSKVQAHAKWQAKAGWKYETNILPQQSGYELAL